MDEKTLTNLRDAGCDEAFIAEVDALTSSCAKLCRLKPTDATCSTASTPSSASSNASTTSSISCDAKPSTAAAAAEKE